MSMDALRDEVAAFGLNLSDQQVAAFAQYQECLQSWNRRINLTTVDDAVGIRRRHFLDSLTCATVTGDLNGQYLVDVGSGAGFPGLPLKILYPRLHLTLVESTTKKVRFLREVSERLAMSDVQIVDARAETVGQDAAFRGRYDWAVARAVAPLNVLLEYLLPLCKVGGHAMAMKSVQAWDEVEEARDALAILGGGNPELHEVQLPDRRDLSYLVVARKIKSTPPDYPRRPGRPAKRPL